MKKVLGIVFAICCVFAIVSCDAPVANMIHHEAKAATCDTEGTKEYWTAEGSDVMYADEAGTIVLQDAVIPVTHNMVFHAGVPATCTSEGFVDYYRCETCGIITSDAVGKHRLDNVVIGRHVSIDPTTGCCDECGNFIVKDGNGLVEAVSEGIANIGLSCEDTEWLVDLNELEFSNITLDLCGCTLHVFDGYDAVFEGTNFTVKNGTIIVDNDDNMVCFGKYQGPAADYIDVNADEMINVSNVEFDDAKVVVNSKFVNFSDVNVSAKNGALCFNGGSGTLLNVHANAYVATALDVYGFGTVDILDGCEFGALEQAVKVVGDCTVNVQESAFVIVRAGEANIAPNDETCLYLRNGARFNIFPSAVFSMETNAFQGGGAIDLSGSADDDFTVLNVMDCGTLMLNRDDSATLGAGQLFFASEPDGAHRIVFEAGSSVQLNGTEMGTVPETELLNINMDGGKVYDYAIDVEDCDPRDMGLSYVFYDFR